MDNTQAVIVVATSNVKVFVERTERTERSFGWLLERSQQVKRVTSIRTFQPAANWPNSPWLVSFQQVRGLECLVNMSHGCDKGRAISVV